MPTACSPAPEQPAPAKKAAPAAKRPLMAGWPVADPATTPEVTELFAAANHRLGMLPDTCWADMGDIEVMAAAFPDWRVVDTTNVPTDSSDVTPRVLLRHATADRWLLLTGAGERLCATRADRPERPYRLVTHPRYHRAWTGTFEDVLTSLRAMTPSTGWHRLPLWLARAVAAYGDRSDATRAERTTGEQASVVAAAMWTMNRLTIRR